ncbi:MAG: pyrroline-5-carboxylate reductase [Candidatus Omnitrophota bacterium]|nr:pyrroline-5-carboxylate reductase [Candidatus Omnitrophota bacterium]
MFKNFRKKIGIIGAGNMGSAIAERIKRKYHLFVFDKDKEKVNRFKGVKLSENSSELAKNADVIILAVKPQDFDFVLGEVKDCWKNKLFVSIAAGITTNYIEKQLGNVRVVRVMPNMPARIGRGMSCLCKGKFASKGDVIFAKKLFDNLGKTLILNEDMMDAATAVSGSGPGFWCERLEDKPKDQWEKYSQEVFIPEFTVAAEGIGFNRKDAKLLARSTAIGTLVTVQFLGEEPSKFKWSIVSKGGTTEAGLEALHKGGTLTDAVKAAVKRAKELSRKE